MIAEMRLVFTAFPSGSLGRAFAYAAVTELLSVAAIGLVTSLQGGTVDPRRPLSAILVMWAIAQFALTVASGVAFYLSQTLLRGRATLRTCLRASAYLTALDVVFVVNPVLPSALGLVTVVAAIGMWIWGWTLLGQGRAGLSRSRAITSAVATIVIGLIASGFAMAVTGAAYIAMSGRLH